MVLCFNFFHTEVDSGWSIIEDGIFSEARDRGNVNGSRCQHFGCESLG